MAKETKKPETVKAPPKPEIKRVDPETALGSQSVALTPYQPGAVAEFGNKFLVSLVMAAAVGEKAQQDLNASQHAKQLLSFEMTRAIFDLATKNKDGPKGIDVYAVFSENSKDVEKLNSKVLIAMGAQRKEIGDDDAVRYVWTSDEVEGLYAYTKALKESDPVEFAKRERNRKALNQRLNEAYKAVTTLLESKLTPDDLFYTEDENGVMVPTIRNAPKEIAGEEKQIQMNTRKAAKGATYSPTMASLVKLATDKHKPKGKRPDAGEHRTGEAKLGISDEDFGRMVNTLRTAVNAQEGNYSQEMVKQVVALVDFLTPIVAHAAAHKAA